MRTVLDPESLSVLVVIITSASNAMDGTGVTVSLQIHLEINQTLTICDVCRKIVAT